MTRASTSSASSSDEGPEPDLAAAPVPTSVFASDSTPLLVKKYMIYKLMGSDIFINHALGVMTTCYQVLGIPVTNKAINTSVGTLFTSGETIGSLMKDIAEFEKQNINGLANYALEGLATMDEGKI
jgi:hypothetical protein